MFFLLQLCISGFFVPHCRCCESRVFDTGGQLLSISLERRGLVGSAPAVAGGPRAVLPCAVLWAGPRAWPLPCLLAVGVVPWMLFPGRSRCVCQGWVLCLRVCLRPWKKGRSHSPSLSRAHMPTPSSSRCLTVCFGDMLSVPELCFNILSHFWLTGMAIFVEEGKLFSEKNYLL